MRNLLRFNTEEDESEESEMELNALTSEDSPEYVALTDVFKAIQSRTTQYQLPEDVYSHAFLAVAFKSSNVCSVGNAECVKFVFVMLLMFAVWAMQMALITSVAGSAAHANWGSDVEQFQSLAGIANQMSTRISEASTERMCGTFTKLTNHDHSQDADISMEYHYVPFPANKWSENPVIWDANEMSKLEEALHGLSLLEFRFTSLYEYRVLIFAGAILAWSCSLALELKDVKAFTKAIFSLDQAGLQIENPPVVESNDPLIVKSLPRNAVRFAMLIVFLRGTLACLLWPAGCLFLASSLSVTELILNAVALVFVLQVDELAYQGVNFFSEGLLRNNLAIEMKNTQQAQFEHRWGIWSQVGTLAVMFVFAGLFCLFEMELMKSKIAMWSSVCLFMGPTPSANQGFDVAFPIPGFCESLVCSKITIYKNNSIVCHDRPMTKPPHGRYINKLAGLCRIMRQSDIEGTYTDADSTSHELGTRDTDEDLAEAKITAEAANFWCPSKTVMDDYGGSVERVENSMKFGLRFFQLSRLTALLGFARFWNHDWECQQELTATTDEHHWQWWK